MSLALFKRSQRNFYLYHYFVFGSASGVFITHTINERQSSIEKRLASQLLKFISNIIRVCMHIFT